MEVTKKTLSQFKHRDSDSDSESPSFIDEQYDDRRGSLWTDEGWHRSRLDQLTNSTYAASSWHGGSNDPQYGSQASSRLASPRSLQELQHRPKPGNQIQQKPQSTTKTSQGSQQEQSEPYNSQIEKYLMDCKWMLSNHQETFNSWDNLQKSLDFWPQQRRQWITAQGTQQYNQFAALVLHWYADTFAKMSQQLAPNRQEPQVGKDSEEGSSPASPREDESASVTSINYPLGLLLPHLALFSSPETLTMRCSGNKFPCPYPGCSFVRASCKNDVDRHVRSVHQRTPSLASTSNNTSP